MARPAIGARRWQAACIDGADAADATRQIGPRAVGVAGLAVGRGMEREEPARARREWKPHKLTPRLWKLNHKSTRSRLDDTFGSAPFQGSPGAKFMMR